MQTKIIVNKMPMRDVDCPFAIKSDSDYPSVCDLQRDKARDIQFGLTFSNIQRCNCNLSEGYPCTMLVELDELLKGE